MPNQTPDEIPSAVIPPREAYAVRAQLAAMPYGGLVRVGHVPRHPEPLTVEDVVVHLAALRDVLGGVARRSDQQDRDLAELRGQRRAVRSFLGIVAPSLSADEVREVVREELDESARIALVKAHAGGQS